MALGKGGTPLSVEWLHWIHRIGKKGGSRLRNAHVQLTPAMRKHNLRHGKLMVATLSGKRSEPAGPDAQTMETLLKECDARVPEINFKRCAHDMYDWKEVPRFIPANCMSALAPAKTSLFFRRDWPTRVDGAQTVVTRVVAYPMYLAAACLPLRCALNVNAADFFVNHFTSANALLAPDRFQ